jgi:hypothetical protein
MVRGRRWGAAFSAAALGTDGALRLMGKMGCDAPTFGNHEFDLGRGLNKSIGATAKAGTSRRRHPRTTPIARRRFLDVIGEPPFTEWTSRST